MPIYEFKCRECGRISEHLCKIGHRVNVCAQVTKTEIPGLVERCEGQVDRVMSIFSILYPWKWYEFSQDGMFYMDENEAAPVEYLYDSTEEEEFYEGPGGYKGEPGELPTRFRDNVRWDQRLEWYRDTHITPEDVEFWETDDPAIEED